MRSKSHSKSTHSGRSESKRSTSSDSDSSQRMKNGEKKDDITNTPVEVCNTKESYRTGHREQVAHNFNERTTDIYAKMALRQRELYKECEKALDKFHDHLKNHKHILADNARMNAIEKLDSVSTGSLTEETVRNYMLYLDNELEKYHKKMELEHKDKEEKTVADNDKSINLQINQCIITKE